MSVLRVFPGGRFRPVVSHAAAGSVSPRLHCSAICNTQSLTASPRLRCSAIPATSLVQVNSVVQRDSTEASLHELQELLRQAQMQEEASRWRREHLEARLARAEAATRLEHDIERQEGSVRSIQPESSSSSYEGDGNSSSSAACTLAAVVSTATPKAPVPAVPPRKRLLKKSKHMAAMAAAAGLARQAPNPSSSSPAVTIGDPSSVSQEGNDSRTGSISTTTDNLPMPDVLSMAVPVPTHLDAEYTRPPSTPQVPLEGLPPMFRSSIDDVVLEGGKRPCLPNDPDGLCVVPKPLYIISDCTGESAARTIRAALNQFELCFQTSLPATMQVFRFTESEQQAYEIIKQAGHEDALVVYTLVNPSMVKAVQTACTLYKVRYVDLWSNLLDRMEEHLHATRSGVPMVNLDRQHTLSGLTDTYFKMIEAVEFTRKMDDGANPKEWFNADLLIVGVSRCGKTPLSIYLGQRGYKVANLPLVPNCPVPRELFQIDQTRVVGLTIDPNVLASIRRHRISQMGLRPAGRGSAIDYAELQKVQKELEWARALYGSNPEWPILDVTLRGIEETAARILKIMNDRRGDASPMWVEEHHRAASAAHAAMLAATPVENARVVTSMTPEPVYSGLGSHEEGLY